MHPGGDQTLRIGGLETLSAVDWPGELTAVVFCRGCTWRCRYCHNPHLLPFAGAPGPAWETVQAWLRRRQGLLDGVVFSGGEPTWQSGLAGAMRAVRELGFKVGLHTGGPCPDRLGKLLPWVDWIGFDFKAPFDAYERITGRDDGANARASLTLIRAAGIACEIRTTWHPDLLSTEDLETMATTLVELRLPTWILQRFRPDGCADEKLRPHPLASPPLDRLRSSRLHIAIRG